MTKTTPSVLGSSVTEVTSLDATKLLETDHHDHGNNARHQRCVDGDDEDIHTELRLDRSHP